MKSGTKSNPVDFQNSTLKTYYSEIFRKFQFFIDSSIGLNFACMNVIILNQSIWNLKHIYKKFIYKLYIYIIFIKIID